jgi:protein O-mannosyl-transferase
MKICISNRNLYVVFFSTIIVAIYFAYNDIGNHSFLHWDDLTYIHENPIIKSGEISSLFSENVLGGWHPLTWLSLALDTHLFGTKDPFYYKVHNVLLHFFNCLLVGLLCFQLIIKLLKDNRQENKYFLATISGYITSILFAVHPQHVESVVWIVERKDLLFSFFYLSALTYYLHNGPKITSLQLCILTSLGVASMLAKPMGVTLPATLIVIDYFIFKSFNSGVVFLKNIIRQHALLILASILISIFTIIAQSNPVGESEDIINRFLYIPVNLNWHIVKFFFPFNLSPYYHHMEWLENQPLYSFLLLFPWIIVVWAILTKRLPEFITAGIVFYVITISPTVGILGFHHAIVADRYAYLPTVPLFCFAGYLFTFLIYKFSRIKIIFITTLLFQITFLIGLTHSYTMQWRNDLTLWSKIGNSEKNIPPSIHLNYANALYENNQIDLAIHQYQKLLEEDPSHVLARKNLALLYISNDRPDLAIVEFRALAQFNAEYPWPLVISAKGMNNLGETNLSLLYINMALDLEDVDGHINYEAALLFIAFNQTERALASIRQAIKIDNDNPDFLKTGGEIERHYGNKLAAIQYFKQYLSLRPDDDTVIQILSSIVN